MRLPTTLIASAAILASSAFATPTEDGIYALFKTNSGEFTAELFYEQAPISCANFIGLAEGSTLVWDEETGNPVSKPFYDGLLFHRVVDDFVIQGGDPEGDGTGGPGYLFPDEVRPELKHDKAGILSMANSGPNTNGSQFFITLNPENTGHLNGLHNVFGEVVEGIDIVQAIGNAEVNNAFRPTEDIVIESVQILRIGDAAEAFTAREHIFPETTPASLNFNYDNTLGPIGRVEGEEETRYVVTSSNDLETWTDDAYLAGNLESSRTFEFGLTENLTSANSPKFFRVSEIQGHSSIDKEGAKIVVTSPGANDTDYIEEISLEEDFTGTYTIPAANDEQEDLVFQMEYGWFDIDEDRSQLLVVLTQVNSNTPYFQYYFDWEDESGGTVFIRDAIEGLTVEGGTFTYQTE